MPEAGKTPHGRHVFIAADHGTAIVYFLRSDVVRLLLEAGVEVTVLTDDETKEHIASRFARKGLSFEGLRMRQLEQFARTHRPRLQWLLGYLRRVGGSWRINSAAMDSHVWEVWTENSWKFRLGAWLPAAVAVIFLRLSRLARRALVRAQSHLLPREGIYADLFVRLKPDLVIASTPGWRLDRYLLREARIRGVPTATAIVGWDNPSSYTIPGAAVDWVTCWSAAQKDELVLGSDWPTERVNVGGIPAYDGYLRRTWLIPREDYIKMHGLDRQRRLISYASSFVHFAPNLPNIRALANLIANDKLEQPAQLLIRLHPSHFQDRPRIFAEERAQIAQLAADFPHVHVVQPVPLGGSLGYYGGEDMDEKASMMAYSDIVVTVYSTMLVETAIHDTPMIAATLDAPGGWNVPRKYSLALKAIGNWPTHKRFRQAGAGRVAASEAELKHWLNAYLATPDLDQAARRRFVEQEITFVDGSASQQTAAFLLGLLQRSND
jgi:hypothetical protein